MRPVPGVKKMTKEEFERPDVRIEDLPPAEQEALRQKQEAVDRFFADKIVAKYKIEVQFGKGRSMNRHFPGSLHVYRSGSVLAGGGDEILYPCPDDKCPGYIEPEHVIPKTEIKIGTNPEDVEMIAFCPVCRSVWDKVHHLQEGRMFRLTHQNWAAVIHRTFERLGHNADIYLKSHPEDIRDKSLLEQMKQRKGEEYLKAYKKRVYVMYPLDRIVADVHAMGTGADIYKLILAFITA